jgi:hypothetical protein
MEHQPEAPVSYDDIDFSQLSNDDICRTVRKQMLQLSIQHRYEPTIEQTAIEYGTYSPWFSIPDDEDDDDIVDENLRFYCDNVRSLMNKTTIAKNTEYLPQAHRKWAGRIVIEHYWSPALGYHHMLFEPRKGDSEYCGDGYSLGFIRMSQDKVCMIDRNEEVKACRLRNFTKNTLCTNNVPAYFANLCVNGFMFRS